MEGTTGLEPATLTLANRSSQAANLAGSAHDLVRASFQYDCVHAIGPKPAP